HKQELTQLLENNLKLSIYVKEELDVNACIVEHPFGQIDASIDTQLSQIKQILQDVVQENGHE
ncbi:flagellar assembly protein FliH, partial [Oceanobacillus caeni]